MTDRRPDGLRVERLWVVVAALCVALLSLTLLARHVVHRVTPPAAKTAAPPPPPPKPRGAHVSAVVLCYHRLAESPAHDTVMQPSVFAEQMAWLQRNGYRVIRLTELVDALVNRTSVHGKSVVLTFDDGFNSDYRVLYPLLKQYNYPATLFVYTKWVGHARGADTWDELKEMAASGLVEVQSHTVNHANLLDVSNGANGGQRLGFELSTSKATIESQLGAGVTLLAYPYGRIDQTVEAATRAAGYRAAFTVNGKAIAGTEDLLRLGRRMVFRNDSLTRFASRVANRPLGLRGSSPLPDEPCADPQPAIRAELAEGLAPTEAAVRLDKQVVPAQLDAEKALVTARPATPLAPGRHEVVVSVVDHGVAMQRTWSFEIAAPPAGPVGGKK